MPPSVRTPTPASSRAAIPLRDAALGWVAAWLFGQLLASAVVSLSGVDTIGEAGAGWFALVAFVQWVPMLAMVWVIARRDGTGDLVADYGIRFRPIDLLGIPMGIVTQVVLLWAVYWPLRTMWPDTFSPDELEQRARELWNSTSGGGWVVLVLFVAVGAPLVEEVVYRGLLQGALGRTVGRWLGLVLAAAWFAAIHFQPIELPGLFVAGLVFGIGLVLTDRLGMGILAHIAFNATGLYMVARR